MENYEQMKIPTLKNLARERGLYGYSRLKKAELIKKISEPIQLRDRTRSQLKQLAKERGLTRYHNLKKAELIKRLKEHGSTILDRDVRARMANVPILTPTPYVPPQATPTPYTLPQATPTPLSSNVVKDLLDYLNNVEEIPVSPELKELQEKIKSIYEQRKKFEVRESDSALRNFAKVYTIDGIEGYDARTFLFYARRIITRILRNNRNTKVKLIFKCQMIHSINNIIIEFGFHSNIEVNLKGTDKDNIYTIMTVKILEKIARHIKGDGGGGIGWAFYRVMKLELHTVSYKPVRGETWIPLPKELADKKVIISMQNKDNKCFLWSVLRAALNPKDNHPERVDKDLKLKENNLNMEGIEYPVSLKDIDKFENQNQPICIVVFGYDGKIVYPLRNSNNMDREHKIILMLIEKDGVKHYCLVKEQSRLLSSQVSNHNGKHHFCDRCFNHFGVRNL